MSLKNKVITEYTQNGVIGVLRKASYKFNRTFFYTTSSDWFEKDLDDITVETLPEIEIETEFLIENKERLIKWLKKNKSKFPWIYFEKEIDAALSNKHIFFIITYQKQIVGYAKIGIGQTYIHDFDQIISFPQKWAFLYDTFVRPDCRRKYLASFALFSIAQYFQTNNYEKLICHIESWNTPSIKTFERAGFRKKNTIRFNRLTILSFFIRNGFIPFLSLENYLYQNSIRPERRNSINSMAVLI